MLARCQCLGGQNASNLAQKVCYIHSGLTHARTPEVGCALQEPDTGYEEGPAPVEGRAEPSAEDLGSAVEESAEEPDLEAPLLVTAADSDEKAVQPALPVDRSLLGLGLYALSGCFLSTMLMLSKKLSALPSPLRIVLAVVQDLHPPEGLKEHAHRPAQHPRL